MKPAITTHILLTVKHDRLIPGLADIAAGRIYTLDGVTGVVASVVSPEEDEREPLVLPVFDMERTR